MTYPLTTTLNRIWACDPCNEGKERALKAAGKAVPDDEPITYQQIVEAVGIDDALWCCKVEPQHDREWRLFAVWCARQVQHLMADERSIAALDVAERHANGEATDEELAAARAATWAAAWTATSDAARTATSDAAWAAASDAAWAATSDAAWTAASDAARAAARTATIDAARATTRPTTSAATWAAARTAAWTAAGTAARTAASDAQRDAFIQLVTTGELPEIVRQEVQP